jgi:hypothetical protein
MKSPAEYNPYEAPEQNAESAIELSLQPWRTAIQRFRQETRALAGTGIFFAIVAAVMTFAVWRGIDHVYEISFVVGMLGSVLSAGLFVVGLQIARKQMLAVRILMTLAYALLTVIVAPLLFVGVESAVFAIFAGTVLGFVAAQCHRVIRYSRILTSAGISLHTKPHELTLHHLTPVTVSPRNVSDSSLSTGDTVDQ